MGCGASCGPICGSDPDLCCGSGPGLCCGTIPGFCCGSDCGPGCNSSPGLCCGSGPGLCCGSSPGLCCDSQCGPCWGSNNGLCCGSSPGLWCGSICGPCCGVCLTKPRRTSASVSVPPSPTIKKSEKSVQTLSTPSDVKSYFVLGEYQSVDLTLYDTIFADIDFSDLFNIDPNLFNIEVHGSKVASIKHSISRKPTIESSKEKYFTHGDSCHIVSELGTEKHACIKSLESKEMKIESHKLQIINEKIEQLLLERIKEITKREEEAIRRHIHDRKIIEEAIVQSGDARVQDCESHYIKLLEEYIGKLHITMVKYLDDLQKNMRRDETRLFDKSQKYIEEITLKSQRGKKELLNRIYPTANKQIQKLFLETNESFANTKNESIGREELRTINLRLYSTTGQYDSKIGYDHIADRAKFIKDINNEKTRHTIKRTVYLESNPDLTIYPDQTATQRN